MAPWRTAHTLPKPNLSVGRHPMQYRVHPSLTCILSGASNKQTVKSQSPSFHKNKQQTILQHPRYTCFILICIVFIFIFCLCCDMIVSECLLDLVLYLVVWVQYVVIRQLACTKANFYSWRSSNKQCWEKLVFSHVCAPAEAGWEKIQRKCHGLHC